MWEKGPGQKFNSSFGHVYQVLGKPRRTVKEDSSVSVFRQLERRSEGQGWGQSWKKCGTECCHWGNGVDRKAGCWVTPVLSNQSGEEVQSSQDGRLWTILEKWFHDIWSPGSSGRESVISDFSFPWLFCYQLLEVHVRLQGRFTAVGLAEESYIMLNAIRRKAWKVC